MDKKLLNEDFQFGGKIVYIEHSRKDYAAYHVDELKDSDTEESIKERGTLMSYICKYAAEHNTKKIERGENEER